MSREALAIEKELQNATLLLNEQEEGESGLQKRDTSCITNMRFFVSLLTEDGFVDSVKRDFKELIS